MKTILSIVWLCLCMLCNVYAQVPQGITYQAVVRDNNGNIRANEDVLLGLSMRQGTPTGTVVYEEQHNVSTNNLGLVNLIVGDGISSQDFSTIDWTQGALFVEIELDGQVMGTTPLLTVPFAFHAETVEKVDVAYSDVSNAPQSLSEFTDDIGILTNSDLNDNSPTNEIQSLSISGNTLTLSNGGGTVPLPINEATTRSISFPANGLNYSVSSTVVTNDAGGLRWTNNFSGSATIAIRKPADYIGGTVKFYIFFRTTSATSGTVGFFIRPRSFDSNDGFIDVVNLTATSVNVSGTEGFGTQYEQTYDIPSSRLGEDWWYISIQRESSNNSYLDDVIVSSVALEYQGN